MAPPPDAIERQVAAPVRPAADHPEPDGADGALTEVRDLLFGAERRELAELRRRLDTFDVTAEQIAERLPGAIALRGARDQQLAVALAPAMDRAIGESVRRDPRSIATAIFPVLGPAIRKAIAEAMAGLAESVNRAVEHSLSPRALRWRLEAWRTGVPFAQVVIRHTLVYRVEQVFLVHAETGLLLAHVPDDASHDAALVSSMMTAIRDFVSDSFDARETGELRTFSIGDVSVVAEPGPRAYLAAVVRGQHPPALVEKLQRTLETIHAQWSDALAAFAGDTAPFAGTQPILADCLDTVLARATRETRCGVARVAWVLPLALVLLAVGVPWLRARARWQRAVAALAAEPGLVLVRAERGWHGGTVVGLRDPLARDPRAVLAAAGLDPARVAMTWEPFVSAAPALAVARARRVLAPPAGVALRLAADTLVAEGVAPAAWIARAASLGPALPGVGAVALGRVSAGLPGPLEAMRRDLEARRVLFAVGSAALDDGARATLAAFAPRFEALRRGAVPLGFDVTLRLVGRTDPAGTEALNRTLSRRRADAVRGALEALGVRAIVAAEARAASDPLPGEGEARARVNRSVSFHVGSPVTTAAASSVAASVPPSVTPRDR